MSGNRRPADNLDERSKAGFDARLTEALQQRPKIGIPADFAIRIASLVPQAPAEARSLKAADRYLRPRLLRLALFFLIVVISAFSVAAPAVPHSPILMLVVWSLALELAAVAVWIGREVQARP